MLHQQLSLNCAGKLLPLDTPRVMGILNVTPDSFYDGGYYEGEKAILTQVEKMLVAGASIIDIGGMSSRPGARLSTPSKELQRVLPVVKLLKQIFPETILSIDTVHAQVARRCVEAGVGIVNDISAGKIDHRMYQTVAELGVPYVLMHMQGQPQRMQQAPNYDDVLTDVLDFFIKEVGTLRTLGVKDIILDVGFGFGKTTLHNFHLLKNMHAFQMMDLPLLAGISRKSMIYKTLKISPQEALNGTTALHIVALQQGAKLLRVHDVKEAVQTIRLWKQLQAA